MKLIYNIDAKPKQIGYLKTILFAFQQLLAIIAATIVVPVIINGNVAILGYELNMSSAAALFGAGVGTLVYQLFTKFKSPVFLGSSFAFLGSMTAAFSGAVSSEVLFEALGYLGLILGAAMAGLVYVILSILVKFVGVKWINKLMPPVVIGPTVALIGLSLAGSAVKDIFSKGPHDGNGFIMTTNIWVSFICAMVTLFTVILCSTYGKKIGKLFPFIFGILAGYGVALTFTVIGHLTDNVELMIINFAPFKALVADGVTLKTFFSVPEFPLVKAIDGLEFFEWSYVATIAVAYIPVAFVVFAEHIADHKNLSSIIEKDLLEEPGLHRTLLGDGVGSIAGAIFGGCPNTTYGESVGCVAITKNASVATITITAFMAIAISFLSPFVAFLSSIPGCVMGGVCITLYGFIAVSGLKMIQKVDLENNANLFTTAVILITGIGGTAMSIGKVTITSIACALILGIITNTLVNLKKSK